MTEWRPVVGWEGLYEVSDHGRVRSLPRVVIRRDGKPQRVPGGLLKYKLDHKGYPYVRLSDEAGRGERPRPKVHVLMLEAFVGPRPPGAWGCHADDVSTNNVVPNLRWDQPVGNAQDRVRNGNDAHARQTSCKREHALVGPNLIKRKRVEGGRGCRACQRGHSTVQKARERGVLLDLRQEADRHYTTIMKGAA